MKSVAFLFSNVVHPVYVLRSMGGDSDRFGPCDVCDRHCAELFVRKIATFKGYVAGGVLIAPVGAGLYGHRACLEAGAQYVLDHNQLDHVGDRWRVAESLLAAWVDEA